MAELATLARPYARAAFDHAREAGVLEAWSEALALAAAIAQDSEVHNLLTNPELTTEEQLALFEHPAFDDAFRAFLRVMAEKGRLLLLPKVAELFVQYKKAWESKVDVELISAVPLDDELQKQFAERLANKLGKQVDIHNHVNPEILGGAIIKAGDLVIDGSLRAKIAKMAETLAS
ncbi:MAG: F0F1 ATP synthase subunit delta [Gammaproteobacteria bacterium]|nr:MAG: F0F1 ATP synthase subunit delta [Gammaproteobacteria bacterium]